ncbi:MAG TPA: TIGR02679 family protein [Actinospica sp.]|jgi:uncharacterized protein (TIGR02679 family)|nr:TIGR02679 family protein [Actinospica sp.]
MTETTRPLPEHLLETAFPHTTYGWLRRSVRATLEARPNAAAITLDADAMSQSERETLRWLLRLPALPHGSIRVSLRRLDQALIERTDAARDTRTLLTALDGPLADLPEQRRREAAERDQVWARAAAHPTAARSAPLQQWLDQESAAGRIPADPQVRDRALRDALTVLGALPCARPTPLTVLAAVTLGSAHALDPGLASSLVLRALALQLNTPAPVTAEQERELWLTQSVVPDELSSRVLLHGFRPADDSPVSQILRISAEAGTPCVLTLQQIEGRLGETDTPLLEPGSSVWMFENVAVMSALAARFAHTSPPLLCAEGWPSIAAAKLIGHLRETGCRLRYHGDFDKAGTTMTDAMIARGAEPWLMDADSYQTGVAAFEHLPALPASAIPTAAHTWAPGLTEAMRTSALRLEEEHLIDQLADSIEHASKDLVT